jgi:hypothetical protein
MNPLPDDGNQLSNYDAQAWRYCQRIAAALAAQSHRCVKGA